MEDEAVHQGTPFYDISVVFPFFLPLLSLSVFLSLRLAELKRTLCYARMHAPFRARAFVATLVSQSSLPVF